MEEKKEKAAANLAKAKEIYIYQKGRRVDAV